MYVTSPHQPDINDGYYIGVDNDGKTKFKVCNGSTTMVLTLNEAATWQMIKLLLATIQDKNEEI